MKKLIALVLSLALLCACIAGCGSKTQATENADGNAASTAADDKVITVGASSTPHAEILEQVKDTLAAEGYELKVVVYDDYILPNKALADGELDANYFQHTPYLDDFNKENGTHIVSVAAIHVEPMGLYGGKQTTLDALK